LSNTSCDWLNIPENVIEAFYDNLKNKAIAEEEYKICEDMHGLKMARAFEDSLKLYLF
jgi:hypothetical protein